MEKVLDKVVLVIEVIVAATLVVLALMSLWALISTILDILSAGQLLERSLFIKTVSFVLEVFILVELFRIALAYMNHKNVVPTVLEAALVAVARKFVMFETASGSESLMSAGALALLLFTVALAWYLLVRSQAVAELSSIEEVDFFDKEAQEGLHTNQDIEE